MIILNKLLVATVSAIALSSSLYAMVKGADNIQESNYLQCTYEEAQLNNSKFIELEEGQIATSSFKVYNNSKTLRYSDDGSMEYVTTNENGWMLYEADGGYIQLTLLAQHSKGRDGKDVTFYSSYRKTIQDNNIFVERGYCVPMYVTD